MFSVEELGVRLTGDATGAIKALGVTQDGLKAVEKAAQATSEQMVKQASRLGSLASSLTHVATTAAGILSAIGAAEWFKDAIASFKDLKDAEWELSDAIDYQAGALGNLEVDVDAVLKGYQAFAAEMQKTTGVSRATTLALLAQAEAMESTGKEAEKTVRQALALSKLTGFEPTGFIEAASFLAEGKVGSATKELEKYLPALQKITDPTERLARANQLVEAGFAEIEKAAASWEGQLLALRNQYEDIKIQVGEFASTIADTARVATAALYRLVKGGLLALADTAKTVFTSISGEINAAWEDALGVTIPTWDEIGEAVSGAGQIIKLVFLNLDSIAEGVFTTFQDTVATGVDVLLGAVTGLWASLKNNTGLWDTLRDTIVAAITSATVVFKVFAEVVEFTWGMFTSETEEAGEAIEETSNKTSKWAETFRTVSISVGIATGAITAALTIWKGLSIAIGITSFILTTLHVKQLASVLAWGAWSAAVLVAKGVLLLYNAQMVAYNFLAGLATTSSLAATAAATGQAAANAVLSTSYATVAASMLSVVGTGAILVAGFAGITAAAVGVYKAVTGVIEALGSVGSLGDIEGFAGITGTFREWTGLLGEVSAAAKKSLPLAWELLKASATLALEQVKAYFPPFWEYISNGFAALWDLIKSQFVTTMTAALFEFKTANAGILAKLIPGLDFSAEQQKVEAAAEYARQTAVDLAKSRLKAAGAAFKVPVDTEEITNARKRIDELRQAILDFKPGKDGKGLTEQFQDLLLGKVDPNDADSISREMRKRAAQLTEQFLTPQEKFEKKKKELDELLKFDKRGGIGIETYERALAAARRELVGITHAVERFNAVLVGSPEHRRIVAEYLETLRAPFTGAPTAPTFRAAGGTVVAAAEGGEAIQLLRDIAKATQVMADQPAVELEGADLVG